MNNKKVFILTAALVLLLVPSFVFALDVPQPTSPANGAKDYNLDATILYWKRVPEAATYQYRIKAGNNDFGGPVNVLNQKNYLMASEINPALVPGTTYYWQVRSKNGTTESNWSNASKFTLAALPLKPGLNAPAAGANISRDKNINFAWKNNGTVLFSFLKVWSQTDQTCNSGAAPLLTVPSYSSALSSALLAGLADGHYCWGISACNNIGSTCTAIDSYRDFYLKSTVAGPKPLFAQAAFDNLIFYWEKSPNASAYTIKVSREKNLATGANTVVQEIADANPYFKTNTGPLFDLINASNPGATLYWQVRATTPSGNSSWSAVKTFKSAFIKKAQLTSPANHAVNIDGAKVIFKWNKVVGAQYYRLSIICGEGEFSKDIVVSGTSHTLSSVPADKSCNWLIKAFSDQSNSASEGFDFSTKP